MLVFIIVTSAITIGISRGYLLDGLKDWIIKKIPNRFVLIEREVGKLLFCSQCVGFWVGIIMSIFMNPEWVGIFPVVNNIIAGFVTSLFSSMFDFAIFGKGEEDDKGE